MNSILTRKGFGFCLCVLVIAAVLSVCGCAVHQPHAQRHKKADKVVVCHKRKKTITVARPALDVHLRHGDTSGPCL